MEILRRVTTIVLEAINVGTTEAPRALSIAKDLPPTARATMIKLLHEYKDVFVWSHEDMKGLDPKFYQHQIYHHGCKANPTMAVSDEAELCGTHKRGNRQTFENRVHLVGQKGNMAKPNRRSTQKEWENPGMR